MIEIAYEVMTDEGKAMNFQDLFKIVSESKGFTKKDKEKYISQLYTDINVDGRFLSVGTNMWGLKYWYPVDQTEEDAFVEEKPKKKKKKAAPKKKAKKKAPAEDVTLEDELDDSAPETSDELFDDEVVPELGEEDPNEVLDDELDDEDDEEDTTK